VILTIAIAYYSSPTTKTQIYMEWYF